MYTFIFDYIRRVVITNGFNVFFVSIWKGTAIIMRSDVARYAYNNKELITKRVSHTGLRNENNKPIL